MIRTVFWWSIFLPSTVVFSLLATAAGVFDRSGDTSHNLNRLWARIAMTASGCRVTVKGIENLPLDEGQIIVANHQSGFDIYTLTAYLPLQIRWIAKECLFKIPILGRGMKASGYISINRDNPKKALKALREAAENIKKGRTIVIFPEGTRSHDGELLEFKKGVFHIAKKAKCPIIPLTIDGTFNIMHRSTFHLNPHPVHITIDRPLSFREVRSKSEDGLLADIKGLIQRNLDSRKDRPVSR